MSITTETIILVSLVITCVLQIATLISNHKVNHTLDFEFDHDYGEEEINIVYHEDIDELEQHGDYIDLRAAEDVELKMGEFKMISLGVSMELPVGYYAEVVPRSSTYKNFKVIQTNSMGIIDADYCGTNDIWKLPVYAFEDTVIHKNDRICQFRIVETQPKIKFNKVNSLSDVDRGGFGSTGTK